MVKDYDCEILYHPGKANVVVDALSHKTVSAPIRDVCLRKTMISPLLDITKEARVEGLKGTTGRSSGFGGKLRFLFEIVGGD